MALTNTPLKHPISKNMKHLFHEWWRVEDCASECSLGTSPSPMELLHHPRGFSITYEASPSFSSPGYCHYVLGTHTHTHTKIYQKKKKFSWLEYFTLKLQRVWGTRDFIKLSHWTLQNQIYLAQAFSGTHDQGVTWKTVVVLRLLSVSIPKFWANNKANWDDGDTVSLLMPLCAPETEFPKLDDNVCGRAVLTWGPHRCKRWRGLRRQSKTLSPITGCGMVGGNKI